MSCAFARAAHTEDMLGGWRLCIYRTQTGGPYCAPMGTSAIASMVRLKSLNLSPKRNVGFATHRPHAADQVLSMAMGGFVGTRW